MGFPRRRSKPKKKVEIIRQQRGFSYSFDLDTNQACVSAPNYLRAKRSKSAICRSISSRAESEAERMPWMRSLNSSGLEERDKASSRVTNCLLYKSKSDWSKVCMPYWLVPAAIASWISRVLSGL